MPRIFRSMTREGDRPQVGSSARTLGVRVPGDLPAPDGIVTPGTGGMSVVPAWRSLLPHRIPFRLRHLAPKATGKDDLFIWRLGDGPFSEGRVADGLYLRPDRPTHGVVEPSETMPLE